MYILQILITDLDMAEIEIWMMEITDAYGEDYDDRNHLCNPLALSSSSSTEVHLLTFLHVCTKTIWECCETL